MAPILGIYASQMSGHLVTNSYASIATQTVGSGGASSITFSSIPSTYTHLQVRASMKNSSGLYWNLLRLNGDSTSTYPYHSLLGDGSAASAGGTTTQTFIQTHLCNTQFGPMVLDVLDYANTNKYKTVRTLGGYDANGSGYISLTSGLWTSTAAITSLTFTVYSSPNYAEYSSFALYGIR